MPALPQTETDDIRTSASSAAATAAPSSDHEGLLALARDRFNAVSEAESVLRQEQLTDKRFKAGDQWGEREREIRTADKRPCLTVNRIPQFTKQVTGQARQARPSLTINPVDDNADPDTAEIFQDIVRHIEARSHADVAYDTAVDDQVTMGRGYFRLITEYCDEDSFDLEIRIKRIRNAHSVYYDPRCVEPDYSDAMYAFVVTDFSVEEFKRQFPQADADHLDDDAFDAIGDHKVFWWLQNETIRVAEYFYVEFEEVQLARLSDGQTLPLDQAQAAIAEQQQQVAQMVGQMKMLVATGQIPPGGQLPPLPEPLAIVKTRTAQKRVVKWAQINGLQVLKEGTWPGKWIPIIPVLGDEIDLDGRVDLRGLVRDARDQQRVYNFQVSALVETIGLTPRAPYIIASGQLDGFEKQWKTANTKSWAYLPYKPINSNGVYAPPPQRQSFEPAIAAIVAAIQQADNDLKATTGFYDASLGERGPEQSGKAILARQKQGETGSIHFVDNLSRALWALGRQLIDLIPKIYDVPRVLRLTGLDESKKAVLVHAGNADAVPQVLPKGVSKVYDLGVGRYDVVVQTGPSHSTRRQEAVEMMTQAVTAHPELLQIIGDLYFGSMDWPKARQIAERLKKFLPPQAQDDENGDNPQALKAQLGQLQQLVQERTALLQEASETIRTDKIKADNQKDIALLNARIEVLKLKVTVAAGAQKQDKQIAADASKQDRQYEFEAAKQVHQVRSAREDAHADRRQAQADTLLDAELSQIDAERAANEADQQREMQVNDQREQRAFEAQQGDAAHQRALEQGDRAHQQQLEQGDAAHQHQLDQAAVAHQQQLAQMAAAPAPQPGA